MCPDYVTIEAQDFRNNRETGKLELMVGHHSNVSDTCLQESSCLARNARVMLCKNVDVEDALVNGACGTVIYRLSGLIIRDFKEKAIYCKGTIKEAMDSMSPFLIEQPQPSLNAQFLCVFNERSKFKSPPFRFGVLHTAFTA